MRKSLVLLCLAFACLSHTQAAVYRRGDKISEHFKQLDLAPEEIDPDVAPIGPNRDEIIYETTDQILNVSDNEILDEAAENEIIDESVNEIPQSVATVAPTATNTVAPVTAIAPTEAATPVKGEEEPSGLAKYCKCHGNHCDCCREFNLPLIPIKGPGCARMTYLGNEKMSISLKYGDLTLATRTVSSKRARPICVGLPGGYSQFCSRVYGLSKAKENFKACLGFELKADDEVEAALSVSCFKFGPEGLRVADAEPFPVEANREEEDDDDDIFGFGAVGDEEDEDDYDEDNDDEEEEADDDDIDADTDTDYAEDDAAEEAPADADYGGFSLAGLLEELDDEDDEESKPSSTPAIAATRTAIDSVQSKDDKGTAAATATATEATETAATIAAAAPVVTAVADQVTSAPLITPSTTAKTKKSKKTRKNKKKKADTEEGFAYELLNGLLDFFN